MKYTHGVILGPWVQGQGAHELRCYLTSSDRQSLGTGLVSPLLVQEVCVTICHGHVP